ncbi:MAG: helix-turn-helix transcriptional regulator [Spirochaetales bacterium]|nr:helix-turn-helix transcriptional regulator [Spirochaetales bacterium]
MSKKCLSAFIIIVPILLLIPTFLFFFDKPIVLFPNSEYTSRIEATASQNSKAEISYPDSKTLSLTYQLQPRGKGGGNPYSGIVCWLKKEKSFMNLSNFDYLSLEIENTSAKNVVLFLKTFEEGVSKPEKEAAYFLRHNEYSLILNPGRSMYKINIKDFIAPDWWFDSIGIPKTSNAKKTFTKSAALDFQFIHREAGPLPGTEQIFVLKKIAFYKNYPGILIIFNVITGLCLLFIVQRLFIRKKSLLALSTAPETASIEEIRQKPLELENFKTQELTRFMKYLEEHYFEPQLSIGIISKETVISQAHIRDLVKTQYNCTCRELINQIRINEAKRLLKATDRRVIEIALSIGFKDISTFNRYFKKQEGLPPTDYRNK